MAELKVNGTKDPILFAVDGYRLVLMPMFVQWGAKVMVEFACCSKVLAAPTNEANALPLLY